MYTALILGPFIENKKKKLKQGLVLNYKGTIHKEKIEYK